MCNLMANSKYTEKYKADGKCLNCGQQSRPNKTRCQKCSDSSKKLVYQARKKQGVCVRCGYKKADSKGSQCSECYEKALVRHRNTARKRRDKCLTAYGHKCKCCGETKKEFLTFDHINNDGAEHRRSLNLRTITCWLIKSKFPDTIQILCWNCNAAKQYYGQCPHEV